MSSSGVVPGVGPVTSVDGLAGNVDLTTTLEGQAHARGAYVPRQKTPSLAVIGDSTSLNPGSGVSWPQILQAQSGGRVRANGVQAVPGTTTAQMLATQLPAVLAMNPKPAYCAVLGGTNDIGSAVALATTTANLTSMYGQLLAAGIQPIPCTITPRNANADVPKVRDLNNWVRATAAILGLACIDFNASLVDWQTGFYAAGLNADTIHPTAAGVFAMVTAALNLFNGSNGGLWTPQPPSLIPIEYAKAAGENASAELIFNPLLIDADANNIPDGWGVSDGSAGTAVGTVVNDGRFIGKAFKVIATAQTGFHTLKQQFAQTRWAVGDRLRLICAFAFDTVSGMSGSNGVAVSAQCLDGATNPQFFALNQWAAQTPAGVALVASVDFTVPANTVNLQPQSVLTLGGGSGTFYIGQFGLVNLTTLGITAAP